MDRQAKIGIGIGVAVGVIAVTGYIYRNEIKALTKRTFGGYEWFETGLQWYRDGDLKDGVATLHPLYQDDVKELFSWMELNSDWMPVGTSWYRDFADQQRMVEIYGDGAAPVGYSKHNYGFAFDMVLRNKKTGEQLRKSDSQQKWLSTGIPQQAEKMGFKWGGRFGDNVHFGKKNIPSTTEMLALVNAGEVDRNGYVKV